MILLPLSTLFIYVLFIVVCLCGRSRIAKCRRLFEYVPDGTYEYGQIRNVEHALPGPPNFREIERPMAHQKRFCISILSIAIPTCPSQVALFNTFVGRISIWMIPSSSQMKSPIQHFPFPPLRMISLIEHSDGSITSICWNEPQ